VAASAVDVLSLLLAGSAQHAVDEYAVRRRPTIPGVLPLLRQYYAATTGCCSRCQRALPLDVSWRHITFCASSPPGWRHLHVCGIRERRITCGLAATPVYCCGAVLFAPLLPCLQHGACGDHGMGRTLALPSSSKLTLYYYRLSVWRAYLWHSPPPPVPDGVWFCLRRPLPAGTLLDTGFFRL
jgi:hypothetical protein